MVEKMVFLTQLLLIILLFKIIGLYQAIEHAKDSLANVKFVQEKETISKFFEEIKLDSGKYVYGVNDTMKALEGGAIDKLLVLNIYIHINIKLIKIYEECDLTRLKLINKETQRTSCIYLKPN